MGRAPRSVDRASGPSIFYKRYVKAKL